EVDGMPAGIVLNHVEEFLELEATLEAFDLKAKLANKFVERPELDRVGVAMHTAEKNKPLLLELRCYGDVGRQHELLDHLVALGVDLDVGPRHAALVVEVNLHLGHRELERPGVKPALTKDHRQFEHLGQQSVELRGKFGWAGFLGGF